MNTNQNVKEKSEEEQKSNRNEKYSEEICPNEKMRRKESEKDIRLIRKGEEETVEEETEEEIEENENEEENEEEIEEETEEEEKEEKEYIATNYQLK